MTDLNPFKVRWNDHFVSCFSLMYHWNQYKYIVFDIFSCRILIIAYKMLIITRIPNETTNELTICTILCLNVTTFYRLELASLFQVQEKLTAFRNSKWNFSSCCFIADDSLVKIVGLQILHFRDNVHLLKFYPVKVPQKCFNSFNCSKWNRYASFQIFVSTRLVKKNKLI